MKKIFITFIIFWSLLFSSVSFGMDQKLKILGVMSGYGVVGGSLLGAASMAFGTSARSIARGASLGLYGGILFGSYIVLSYEMKKRGFLNERPQEDYYPEAPGTYENNQTRVGVPDLKDYALTDLGFKAHPEEKIIFSMNLLSYEF